MTTTRSACGHQRRHLPEVGRQEMLPAPIDEVVRVGAATGPDPRVVVGLAGGPAVRRHLRAHPPDPGRMRHRRPRALAVRRMASSASSQTSVTGRCGCSSLEPHRIASGRVAAGRVAPLHGGACAAIRVRARVHGHEPLAGTTPRRPGRGPSTGHSAHPRRTWRGAPYSHGCLRGAGRARPRRRGDGRECGPPDRRRGRRPGRRLPAVRVAPGDGAGPRRECPERRRARGDPRRRRACGIARLRAPASQRRPAPGARGRRHGRRPWGRPRPRRWSAPSASTRARRRPPPSGCSPRTSPPATSACRRCWTRPTGATATRSRTAPTAARGPRSSTSCRTTGPAPRCVRFRSARPARAGVRRSRQPPLPRGAGGLPGLRPAPCVPRDGGRGRRLRATTPRWQRRRPTSVPGGSSRSRASAAITSPATRPTRRPSGGSATASGAGPSRSR